MDGKGCECFARCEADCVCDADWTPEEVIRLRAEISTAEAFHKVAVAERNYERQRADILESATIKALEDRDRLRAELAECKRQRLASTVVTYEVASSVFGDRPQLTDDCTRRAFFAVWALAIKELAEALAQEKGK